MVECEFNAGFFCDKSNEGFNRYMVECESFLVITKKVMNGVLIDTWWNVNSHSWCIVRMVHLVLIDTWWNVNFIYATIRKTDILRFNRYMVECECCQYLLPV